MTPEEIQVRAQRCAGMVHARASRGGGGNVHARAVACAQRCFDNGTFFQVLLSQTRITTRRVEVSTAQEPETQVTFEFPDWLGCLPEETQNTIMSKVRQVATQHLQALSSSE